MRFAGQLGSQSNLIRAPDGKECGGQSGSQRALIRAPDCKNFNV